MKIHIRPFTNQFESLVPLLNGINPEPTTAERLEAAHAAFPAAGLRHRSIALDEAGRVVGYANASHWPGARPGAFNLNLVVAPDCRRQGAGSALLAAVEEWLASQGDTKLYASAPDTEEESVQFARSRGFTVTGHQLESVLQVSTFNEQPFAGVVDRVAASGIRFVTYAEIAGAESLQKLYELYKVTDLDSPGYAGTNPADYPPFERWHEDLFGSDATLHDGLIIALDGDRFVGTTIVQREADGGLYTEYTGVLKEYRGRSIGLALKLLSVRFAHGAGVPTMRTKNDASNAAMLAVNVKMGYTKVSGRYWLAKSIAGK